MSGNWCRYCEIWNLSDQNYCKHCGAELFKITYHATGQRGRPSNAEMSDGAKQRERDFKQWYVKHYPKGENTVKTYCSKLKNIVDKMPDTLQKKLKSNLFEYDDAKEFENVKNILSSSTASPSFDNKNHAQASTAMTQYLSFLRERSGDVDNNNKIDFALHKNRELVPPAVISDETVVINGNSYRLYRKEDETVQDFIRNTTEKLLKTNSIPVSEIKDC